METMIQALKLCPFCSETLSHSTIECTYCHEILDANFRVRTGQTTRLTAQLAPKRRWHYSLAAGLSILPGAGHLYRGSTLNGLLWVLLVAMGYFLFSTFGLLLHLLCLADSVSGNPYK